MQRSIASLSQCRPRRLLLTTVCACSIPQVSRLGPSSAAAATTALSSDAVVLNSPLGSPSPYSHLLRLSRVRAHVLLGRPFRERRETLPAAGRREQDLRGAPSATARAALLHRRRLTGTTPGFLSLFGVGLHPKTSTNTVSRLPFPSFFPRRSREGDSPVFAWEDAVVAWSDGDPPACRPLASLAVLPYFTAAAASTLIETRKLAAPEEHH
ncbi:hypothetical protein MRX96_035877 [Rhipicephalus microplus]